MPCWLPAIYSMPAHPATGLKNSLSLSLPRGCFLVPNVYMGGSITEAIDDEVFVLHTPPFCSENSRLLRFTKFITVQDLEVEIVRKRIKNLHFGVYPPHGCAYVSANREMGTQTRR